ncbi:MAG: hypothetical protein JNM56_35480 [Planctomycetia bacterium]|nr:hypothetical protein [Planctomycetia bacterium]
MPQHEVEILRVAVADPGRIDKLSGLPHGLAMARGPPLDGRRRPRLRGDDLRHLTALASTAVLEALDGIGRDLKDNGAEYGSCWQLAVGVTYFMDTAREVQRFPVYTAALPLPLPT